VLDAFKAADQVLLSGVQGITDLITTPGLINLDFADVKSVMSGAGSALMGIGTARGDDRAVAAAEMAISSPLLEASIDGAHGVLLSIQGGSDLGLFEINEAAQLVANSAAPDANIIFGAVIDDALGDEVRVTVIAAGFDEPEAGRARPRTAAYGFSRPSAAASHSGATAGGASAGPAAAGGWRPFRLDGAPPSADGGLAAGPNAGSRAEPGSGGPADGAGRAADGNGAGSAAAADPARVDGVPAPRPGNGSGRPADPAGPRRKSVVFEEDDELDVPDFLK